MLLVLAIVWNFTSVMAAETVASSPATSSPEISVPETTDSPAATSEASIREPGSARSKLSGRFTVLTSRAGGSDYRSFKGTGSDDSGNMSEGSTMPNLNYLTGRLVYTPLKDNQVHVGALQSLDDPSKRQIPLPDGKTFTLPGQIVSLRLMHYFNPSLSLSAGQTYIEKQGFADPSVGLSYRRQVERGWAERGGFSLSVPATLKSENDHLISKATARAGLAFIGDRWNSNAGLSHSRPFYDHASNLPIYSERRLASRRKSSGGSSGSGSGHGSGHGGPGPSGNIPDRPEDLFSGMEQVDVVLSEREISRSTASWSGSFLPSRSWKVGTSAGLTLLQTAKYNAIWMTAVKVLGISYTFKNLEAGSDFQMYSDIHNFKSPALPKLWNVGMHLSYFFGGEQRAI